MTRNNENLLNKFKNNGNLKNKTAAYGHIWKKIENLNCHEKKLHFKHRNGQTCHICINLKKKIKVQGQDIC